MQETDVMAVSLEPLTQGPAVRTIQEQLAATQDLFSWPLVGISHFRLHGRGLRVVHEARISQDGYTRFTDDLPGCSPRLLEWFT